jgi:hypothetical protein
MIGAKTSWPCPGTLILKRASGSRCRTSYLYRAGGGVSPSYGFTVACCLPASPFALYLPVPLERPAPPAAWPRWGCGGGGNDAAPILWRIPRGATRARNGRTTALFAFECKSFLDNIIAGLGRSDVRDYPHGSR